MVGAAHQGIHTDSDYFGSSVMYSRTFLHSYTMFVALQETTPKMGATTLCPGTHFCANEDLENVCMEPNWDGNRNSFEASSNGQTAHDDGAALLQGDAMMFNQNVWHRGPKNKDPERPFTRTMFILTFISQRPLDKGDVRQQGWGTYYYMRHSMWGQAFDDLKTVLQGGMSLPFRFLKAYGLYTSQSSSLEGHSPMPWLEHMARQMANEMDFFTRGELNEFKDMLESSKLFPKHLLGSPRTEDWNEYLLEIIQNATSWMNTIYGGVLLVFLAVHLIGYAILSMITKTTAQTRTKSSPTKDAMGFVIGLAIGHGIMLLAFAAVGYYILFSAPLFRRISSGYIFRQPFPELSRGIEWSDVLDGRITTVPDRMDILIGTRFDANYLASMNDMLDYHPGNREWTRMVQETAAFPGIDVSSSVLVDQVMSPSKPYQGVIRRFLLQDYATGYWTVMNKEEALKETRQALMMEKTPLLKPLASHWRQVLADARFGMLRDTALSTTWIPKTVNAWIDTVLFPQNKKASTDRRTSYLCAEQNVPSLVPTLWSSMTKSHSIPTAASTFRVQLQEMNKRVLILKEGDIVLVKAGAKRDPFLAKILNITDSDRLVVQPIDEYRRIRLHINSIQAYRPVQQGDWVVIAPEEGYEDPDNWILSQVALVYPFGNIDTSVGAAVDDELEDEDGRLVIVSPSEYFLAENELPEYRLDWT
ncbi:MAG: hypothetical protein SGILL_009756 [Bacillariaceae sp.]